MAWVLPSRKPPVRRGRLLKCPHILAEKSALAEELVFEHFKLSSRLFKRLNYDVVFVEDWPFEEGAYAALFKAEEPRSHSLGNETYLVFVPKGKSIPFSRAFLPSFMLYILVHELIHIVRFLRYEAFYYTKDLGKRLEEEVRVHEAAVRALRPLSFLPGLWEVLQYFDEIFS